MGVKYFDAHDQAKPHFEAVTRRPTQAEGWQQCVGADDALQNGTFRNWDVVNCGYCGYVMLCDVMWCYVMLCCVRLSKKFRGVLSGHMEMSSCVPSL